LGLDEDPDGTVGALAKGPCLSLGSRMVAICGEPVCQEFALGLSMNKEGYRCCRVKEDDGPSVLRRRSKVVLKSWSKKVPGS